MKGPEIASNHHPSATNINGENLKPQLRLQPPPS
jgi:hypothetical protein